MFYVKLHEHLILASPQKTGYFWRKLANIFSLTSLFVFVQNKQMTHHIKLLTDSTRK